MMTVLKSPSYDQAPSLISTRKLLPFGELSPLEFEGMCLWLVERQGFLRPQHLGEAGSEQGRDIAN
jgi:hypothetical protein